MQMFRDVKAHVDAKDDGSIRDYLARLLAREVGDRSGKIMVLATRSIRSPTRARC